MRILLDTNIFIPLEDSSIDIDKKLIELNRMASGKHQLLVHPATILDLGRDKNKERRDRIIPRLEKYIKLDSPPEFEKNEEELFVGIPKKENDHVDNLILLALKRNCVHWLVTEDNGIHKKAKLIGEQERVLRVDQAIIALSKQDDSYSNIYPNIEDIFCYSIKIENNFFDSLREAYDFNTWFNEKCAKEGRKTWICREENIIDAICIYKLEDSPVITTDKKGLRGKVLKLCTFKVAKYGYKIGELLLKQAFTYATDNKINHIYVTVEPNRYERLEELFIDFGFYQYGIDTDGRDVVFVKDFPNELPRNNDTPLDYAIKFFPLSKISNNSVHIVPIQPCYHKVLFPELSKQADLFSEMNSAGNAIKQAYLCNASTNSIKQGDMLFFYKSQDEMAITSYGIVESFYIEIEPENIFKWVAKRTVYSYEDIVKMSKNGKVKVILFRLIGHLGDYLTLDRLKTLKIVNGSIQSITKIPKDKVSTIIYETKLNNRVLSD